MYIHQHTSIQVRAAMHIFIENVTSEVHLALGLKPELLHILQLLLQALYGVAVLQPGRLLHVELAGQPFHLLLLLPQLRLQPAPQYETHSHPFWCVPWSCKRSVLPCTACLSLLCHGPGGDAFSSLAERHCDAHGMR